MRRALNPTRLLATALFAWLTIFTGSGIRYGSDQSIESITVLLTAIATFALGLTLGSQRRRRDVSSKVTLEPEDLSLHVYRKAIRFGIGVSFFSVAYRMAFSGPIWPSGTSKEIGLARNELVVGGGGVSVNDLGVPLSAFAVATAVLWILRPYGGGSRAQTIGVALSVLQFWAMGLATGARTHLALSSVAMLIAFLMSPHVHRPSRKALGAASTAILAIASVSVWLLRGRLEAIGRTSGEATQYLELQHYVQAPEYLEKRAYATNVIGDATYTIVSIAHYFLHGVFEFQSAYLWRTDGDRPLSLGLSTFGPAVTAPLKALADPALPAEVRPRIGVYSTLWGDLMADFGVAGMLTVGFALGLGFGAVYQRSLRPHWNRAKLLYPPIAAIVLAAPFFNAIAGGYGIYTLLACILIMMPAELSTKLKAVHWRDQ